MRFKKYGKKLLKETTFFYPFFTTLIFLYLLSLSKEIQSWGAFVGMIILFFILGFISAINIYGYIVQPIIFEKGIKPFKAPLIPFNQIESVSVNVTFKVGHTPEFYKLYFRKKQKNIFEISTISKRKAIKQFKKISKHSPLLTSKLVCDTYTDECLDFYKKLKQTHPSTKRTTQKRNKNKKRKRN